MTDADLEIIRRSAVMSPTMPSSVVLQLVDEVRRLRREIATLTSPE